MKTATPEPLSSIFETSDKYIIPRFQRKYEWSKDREIKTLWDDILNTCRTKKNHYIGSIIMMPVKNDSSKFMLIDGQQRLITLTILYRVLYEFAEKEGNIDWKAKCKKAFYLEDEGCRRIERTSDDGSNYSKIINNTQHYIGNKDCADLCYQFFYRELKSIKESSEGITIADILGTLKNNITLMPVNVDNEDPCVLFESVNNTGRRLTAISMMRNYIMLKCVALEKEESWGTIQKEIDETYWKPFNNLEKSEKVLGDFMRIYLTISMGRVTKEDLYVKIKEKVDDEFDGANDLESIKSAADNFLTPLSDYYAYYQQIIDGDKVSAKTLNWVHIKDSIKIINSCGFKSHYSFFLKLFIDYYSKKDDEGKIDAVYLEDLKKKIELIESYIVRRAIVQDLPTNTIDKMFIDLCQIQNISVQTIKDTLLEQDKRGVWPDDDMVKDAINRKDLYGSTRESFCYHLLERICAHKNNNYTERVVDSSPTCEHIVPQETIHWKDFYDEEEYQFLSEHVNRLGNLTPLSRPKNSGAYVSPYNEKLQVYKTSQYKLTNEIESTYGNEWTKATFIKRQNDLIEEIFSIWKKD